MHIHSYNTLQGNTKKKSNKCCYFVKRKRESKTEIKGA